MALTLTAIVLSIIILFVGVKLVASLTDLQTAITNNTAAVNALTAAAGTVTPPHDFQPEVDAIAANTTAVNAVTTQLGGTPPGP
jgi:hypothetical protein